MSLTALESKLLNVADTVVDAAANLVAAKNPAYDSLITLASGLVDQINASVNPTATAAATQIAAAASALTTAAQTAPAAASQVTASTSTATQKASAAGILVSDAESVAKSILALF